MVSRVGDITECYNTSGDYDFILNIYAQNMEHYQDLL